MIPFAHISTHDPFAPVELIAAGRSIIPAAFTKVWANLMPSVDCFTWLILQEVLSIAPMYIHHMPATPRVSVLSTTMHNDAVAWVCFFGRDCGFWWLIDILPFLAETLPCEAYEGNACSYVSSRCSYEETGKSGYNSGYCVAKGKFSFYSDLTF